MTYQNDRYSLMMEAYADLQPEIESVRQTRPIPTQPTLQQVLAGFGPMPDEALFLGVASDELPVLLNLRDPIPGPLLIVSDPGTGKTSLLQTIASAVELMHPPEKVQFGALTNHPEEWNRFENSPNKVGVFSLQNRSSDDFILSLATWAHGNKSSRQSVLLLLDDLEGVNSLEMDAVQNLRWLLLRGPSRRVWPIITMSTPSITNMEPWLQAFRTCILGKIQDISTSRKLDAGQAHLNTLTPNSEFALREGDHWLQFWIPSLDK